MVTSCSVFFSCLYCGCSGLGRECRFRSSQRHSRAGSSLVSASSRSPLPAPIRALPDSLMPSAMELMMSPAWHVPVSDFRSEWCRALTHLPWRQSSCGWPHPGCMFAGNLGRQDSGAAGQEAGRWSTGCQRPGMQPAAAPFPVSLLLSTQQCISATVESGFRPYCC